MAPVPLIAMGAMAAGSMYMSHRQQKQAQEQAKAQNAWANYERKSSNLVSTVSAAQQGGENYKARMEIAEAAALTQRQNTVALEGRLSDQLISASNNLAAELSMQQESFANRGIAGGATVKAIERQTRRNAASASLDMLENAAVERMRIDEQYRQAGKQMDAFDVSTSPWTAKGVEYVPNMDPLATVFAGIQGGMSGLQMGQQIQGMIPSSPAGVDAGYPMGPPTRGGQYS